MQLRNQENLGDEKDTLNVKKVSWERKFLLWTGFSDKKLWDLLQFFFTAAVPIVLTIWSIRQTETATQISRDQERQKVMVGYLDTMTSFLQKEKAQNSDQKMKEREVSIARARTLVALRQLDGSGEQKGQLLRFLYDTGLVGKCETNDALTKDVSNCDGPSILRLGDARLDEINFESSNLEMQGVDLSEARLPRAKLPGIDLSGAKLERATLTEADLAEAALKGANMKSVDLQDSKLKGAVLVKADLTKSLLKRADLSGANLNGAILEGAYLNNANLSNANLENANLRDADLRGVSLNETKLGGAKYNKPGTKFPDNFDPARKGMVR